MGANAQTTVPTFTASQVLTAAEMNASARTGVPVFSSTGNRDAAFGGSGEKTLAEGQLCYVEGTGLQSYNGTSWITWGTAPTGGLTYITGAAFSAVSSVSAPNSTFTSTYTNYLLLVDVSTASTNNQTLLRWRASGTDTTSANYYTQSNDSAGGTASQINVAAGTSHRIATLNPAGTFAQGVAMTIFAPQLARATVHVGQSYDGGLAKISNFGGTINLTTQYDAFTLLTNTGTITGNYRVYGYQNS